MKKALVEFQTNYFTAEDFAKALSIVKFHLNNDVPMDETSRLYCKAVFSDVFNLLEFYTDFCDDVAFDS